MVGWLRLYGCVFGWLCGCLAGLLCGYLYSWLYGCVAMKLISWAECGWLASDWLPVGFAAR